MKGELRPRAREEKQLALGHIVHALCRAKLSTRFSEFEPLQENHRCCTSQCMQRGPFPGWKASSSWDSNPVPMPQGGRPDEGCKPAFPVPRELGRDSRLHHQISRLVTSGPLPDHLSANANPRNIQRPCSSSESAILLLKCPWWCGRQTPQLKSDPLCTLKSVILGKLFNLSELSFNVSNDGRNVA